MYPTGRRSARLRVRSESGKVNWVTVVLLVLIFSAIYFGYKYGPIYVSDYSFANALEAESNNAWENRKNVPKIRKNILRASKLNDIELLEGNWSVYIDRETIYIDVKYVKTVEIPFLVPRNIRFEHKIKKKIEETF